MLALVPFTLFLILLSSSVLDVAHASISPRWGHSLALVPSSSTLIIASGRTTSGNGQTYTSSPLISTYLSIPLSSSFDLIFSAELSTSTTPVLTEHPAAEEAWGSVEALSNGNVLMFGGQLSNDASVAVSQNSAWVMTASNGGAFVQQTDGWGGQPARRMDGASCTLGTNTYFTAGVQPDGSNNPILSTYVFSSQTSTFTLLSEANIPTALVSPSLHCLSNGTLLLLGGYSSTLSKLPPLSTAYSLDTSTSNPAWRTIALGGAQNVVPEGRRGHLGVTLGSRNAIFVHGGGTGSNGLEQVLDDTWVLDVNRGTWTQVQPTGTGPGRRMDHEGVPIGNSQVLFFGGYLTTSAADSRLYVYDLITNSYLSTFVPPSTWTSPSITSAPPNPSGTTFSGLPISTAAIPSGAVATATIVSTYTSPTTVVSGTPVVQTSTFVSSGATYTELKTSSSIVAVTSVQTGTETIYALSLANGQSSTLTFDKATFTRQITAVQTNSVDPATYTGAVAGIGTMPTSYRNGQTTFAGSASSAASIASDTTSGTSSLSSKAKTAIGVGVMFALLSIAAGSATYFLLIRRRRSMAFDDDDDDDLTGRPSKRHGTYHDLEGREKPIWLKGALAAGGFLGKKEPRLDRGVREKGFGFWTTHQNGRGEKGNIGSILTGSEKGRVLPVIWNRHPNARRESMLDDEDSSRFGSWPPYFQRMGGTEDEVSTLGSRAVRELDQENPFEDGQAMIDKDDSLGGSGAADWNDYNQSSGLVSGGTNRQEESDLGDQSPFGDDTAEEDEEPLDGEEGKELLLMSSSHKPQDTPSSARTGGRSVDGHSSFVDPNPLSPSSSYIYGNYQPYTYNDPFAPSSSLDCTSLDPDTTADRGIPRSQGMTSLYGDGATSETIDAAEQISAIHSSSLNGASSQSLHPYTNYIHHNSSAAYGRAIKPSRSTSSTGWRRVLGLRLKSPSPIEEGQHNPHLSSAGINAGGLGRFQEIIRDPATPPVLPDYNDDQSEARILGELGLRRVGRQEQESSVKSMQSGRTATSEQIEQYTQMNVVQRNRVVSSSTTVTPNLTPISSPQAEPIEFPSISQSQTMSSTLSSGQKNLIDPFADESDSSYLKTSTLCGTNSVIIPTTAPGARPTGGRPNPSNKHLTSLPIRPAPSAPKEPRHFLDTPALTPTPALSSAVSSIPQPGRSVRETVAAFETRASKPAGGRPRHKVSYVSVPRPKLTIANPDGSFKR